MKDCPGRCVNYAFNYTTSQLKSTLTFELCTEKHKGMKSSKGKSLDRELLFTAYVDRNMTPLNWTAVCFLCLYKHTFLKKLFWLQYTEGKAMPYTSSTQFSLCYPAGHFSSLQFRGALTCRTWCKPDPDHLPSRGAASRDNDGRLKLDLSASDRSQTPDTPLSKRHRFNLVAQLGQLARRQSNFVKFYAASPLHKQDGNTTTRTGVILSLVSHMRIHLQAST